MWLTLAAVAGFVLPGSSAPVPVPGKTSQGPISDTLRLLEMLPRTAPLTPGPAVMVGDGSIQLERRTAQYVTRVVEVVVKTADGKEMRVQQTVSEAIPIATQVRVKTDACKFYTVNKEGKFEAMDAAKATAMLKQKTAVLTGETADVDPKTLQMVRPGTLCIIFTTPTPTAPPPIVPDEKPRN
jgi:hypothetical protein